MRRLKTYISKSIFRPIREGAEGMDQIYSLAQSDFKGRFSGSYLGVVWGVVQPLTMILVYWFVFQVGFNSGEKYGAPFVLWLAAGMIPWNFFYDAWMNGTAAFTSYHYIVKKVVFHIEYLPFIKELSSFFLNVIFNVILIILFLLNGRWVGVHIIDMIYYSICVFCLTLGLNYITATLNVFMKDVGHAMGVILMITMWMTPLMWEYSQIPEQYSWFYKLNPMHYVLNGYRESLLLNRWFFYHSGQMVWFWFVTAMLLLVGRKLMMQLKGHFADIL